MSRYETRPVYAVLAVANAYRRVTGLGKKAFSQRMGRTPNWLNDIVKRGHITTDLHNEIMAHVAANWPKSHAKPSPVRMFEREHPELVAQAAQPAPEPSNVRKCMCCPTRFVSEGSHNRLCPSCRQTAGRLPAQMAG